MELSSCGILMSNVPVDHMKFLLGGPFIDVFTEPPSTYLVFTNKMKHVGNSSSQHPA